MKIAFVGNAPQQTNAVMQAVKVMCSLLQKKSWICDRLQFVYCRNDQEEKQKKILKQADLVVVNFEQSQTDMERYFQNAPLYQAKSFYLVHNYWEQQEWNRKAICCNCRIDDEKLGTLPYNQHLLSAHQKQTIPTYIQDIRNSSKLQEETYFCELKQVSRKLLQQVLQGERNGFWG